MTTKQKPKRITMYARIEEAVWESVLREAARRRMATDKHSAIVEMALRDWLYRVRADRASQTDHP